MRSIDRRINDKESTIETAINLGFESYSEAILELSEYGKTPPEIGFLFDRSDACIRRHLRELGANINSPGGNRYTKQ